MTNLEVQEPISRANSVKKQLSDLSWKWGLSNFFVEQIPFSGRTGHNYAKKLVNLFVTLLKEEHDVSLTAKKFDKPFYVFEFGAGLGLLSKHFLDMLKQGYPNIYENTYMFVTDSTEESIKKVQTISLFYDHIDRVSFHVLDSTNFKLEPKKEVIFAFTSYLVTSFPSYHIEYSDGKIRELLVKTKLKKDSVVLDTTQYPPKALNVKEIQALIKSDDQEKLRILGPKIVNCLEEEYVPVDIEKSSLDKEDIEELKDFLAKSDPEKLIRFNYTPLIYNHIYSVLDYMHDKGLYIISDFGHKELYDPIQENLVKSYGITLYSSFCFPHLLSIIEDEDKIGWFSNRTSDSTQEFIIINDSSVSEKLEKEINQFFNECFEDNISDTLRALVHMKPGDKYLEEFESEVAQLSNEEKPDYVLLKTCSALLLTNGYNKESYEYALKLMNTYFELAVDAYSIMGYICQSQGFTDEALECFEKMIAVCENDPTAYESVSSVLYSLDNQEEALNKLKLALKFSRNNNIWHLILGIGSILAETGKQKERDQLFEWALEVAGQYPKLVSEDYISKFKNPKT